MLEIKQTETEDRHDPGAKCIFCSNAFIIYCHCEAWFRFQLLETGIEIVYSKEYLFSLLLITCIHFLTQLFLHVTVLSAHSHLQALRLEDVLLVVRPDRHLYVQMNPLWGIHASFYADLCLPVHS